MKSLNRRQFLNGTIATAAGITAGAPYIGKGFARISPNDTVNVAVAGIRSRGKAHYNAFAKIPNVRVAALCDVDERLFPGAVADIEEQTGRRPATFVDFRDLIADKDIDAVALATPDHWHALQTIWACRAGKDVYVEKPVSWCIEEGRKTVEAARKYDRIVQVGSQYRSNEMVKQAVQFIRDGKLGDVYMIKTFYYGLRASIGHKTDSPIPDGVNWDLFLGPAPYRPFNENRFHYNWHWFWDTGNSDLTANGVHFADIARWSLNKHTHPVTVSSDGDYYVFDSDQETPNVISATCKYDDGKVIRFEINNLFSPRFFSDSTSAGIPVGDIFYGSEGWMELGPGEFRTFYGRKSEPGPRVSQKELAPDPLNRQGTGGENHFANFIDCVRSRNRQELNADILEGHLSASICHLAEISYRTKRKLTFNPHAEKFVSDADADSYLTRDYRHPYVVPDKV